MRVLSVCSGAGGLDLGLQRAGMTIVGHCEVDPHARQVLNRHWPEVPCWDDLTTLNGADWHGRADVVAGGTPCTDLSTLGRREGLGGKHSRLFWDFCRVATHSAARWLIWENVAGALSSNSGADFAAVLWGLTGHRPGVPTDGWRTFGVCVGAERAAVWRMLDARTFGTAQRRRRLFVVGCAVADIASAIEVFADPEGMPRDAGPGGTTAVHDASSVGVRTREDRLQVAAFTAKDYGADYTIECSPTLRAGGFDGSHMNGGVMPAVIGDGFDPRRLTPLECERLMSWDDDWTRWGGDGREIADAHRYRMCGNGVVSNVVEHIGSRILEHALPVSSGSRRGELLTVA